MPTPLPPEEHRFSSTNQPANRGRKPSKLKKYIKDNGITSSDMAHAFRYVLGLTIEQLKDLIKDTSKPAIIVVAASAVLKDFTKGKLVNTATVMRKAQVDSEMTGDNSGGSAGGIGSEGAGQFHEYSFPEVDELSDEVPE